MTVATKNRAVADLHDELFNLVEEAQGHAFISDDPGPMTRAQFFERVRGRLAWQRRGVVLLRQFLHKHGELR